MIQGKENLLLVFIQNHYPYWILFNGLDTTKLSSVIAYCNEHEPNFDVQYKELQNVLGMLGPGKYTLAMRPEPKSKTNNANAQFEIAYAPYGAIAPYQQQPAAIAGIGAGNPDYVHRSVMEKEVQKLEFDYRMKEMERRIEEAERKKKQPKSDAIGSFLETYGPVLMGVLANKFGINPPTTAIGMAGFDQLQQQHIPANENLQPANSIGEQPDQDEATQKKLHYVITHLTEKEGSQQAAVELLYRFVLFTQKNPQLYEQFKPMILNTKTEQE